MVDQTMTKAELVTENETLQQDVATLSEERRALEDALSTLEDRVNRMAATMEQQHSEGRPHDPEPVMRHDPFDEQNPHLILSHPDGFVLSWKNPNYRAHRGWRGWVPITYDDEVGKELGKYLLDPPPRMEGMSQVDNYVRRGTDSILCRIPVEIWNERQAKRAERAQSREARSSAVNVDKSKHVSVYGMVGNRSDSARLNQEGGKDALRSQSRMFPDPD